MSKKIFFLLFGISFFSCGGQDVDISQSVPKMPSESNVCGTFRNKKLSDALFQDVRILMLNCDSTFSYKRSNCTLPETSSGSWTLNGNTITLSLTNKAKHLASKEEKTEDGFRYTNLDRTMMTINDSIIIWKRSEKWIDTLYRQ